MTNPSFTLAYFRKDFAKFKAIFDEGCHPEYLYCEFYNDHISGNESKLFTNEEKSEWITEWSEALDEEDLTKMTFEEIIEGDHSCLTEDLTEWVVSSDEPRFAEFKEKFIEALFMNVSEWYNSEEMDECIASA